MGAYFGIFFFNMYGIIIFSLCRFLIFFPCTYFRNCARLKVHFLEFWDETDNHHLFLVRSGTGNDDASSPSRLDGRLMQNSWKTLIYRNACAWWVKVFQFKMVLMLPCWANRRRVGSRGEGSLTHPFARYLLSEISCWFTKFRIVTGVTTVK